MFVAPLEVAYPYKRTVGTLLSRFFMSLQEGRLEGTRGSDGRVYFPPAEFDPVTGAQLDEWVTLPETGTVTTWAWQSVPQPDQPLDRPFAWAMITLDGAHVPLLHAVDAGDRLLGKLSPVLAACDDPPDPALAERFAARAASLEPEITSVVSEQLRELRPAGYRSSKGLA